MESNNEVQTFKEKPDPSKDVAMEALTCIDPGDVSNDQENSNTFTLRSTGGSFSRIILREQMQTKNTTVSKVITAVIIIFIIGTFSVPIILYYALKTDPIPELDSVLRNVNISEVIMYMHKINL